MTPAYAYGSGSDVRKAGALVDESDEALIKRRKGRP
jgi:hypothetical protein